MSSSRKFSYVTLIHPVSSSDRFNGRGVATIEATEAAASVKFQSSEDLALKNSISNIANNLAILTYLSIL